MPKKRAESREGMIVTTVAFEASLHRRLAIAGIEENAALTEIVRQAVEEWLQRRQAGKKDKRRRTP